MIYSERIHKTDEETEVPSGWVAPVLTGRADLEVLESAQGSATDLRPPAGPCRAAVALSGGYGVGLRSRQFEGAQKPSRHRQRGLLTLPSNQADIWACSLLDCISPIREWGAFTKWTRRNGLPCGASLQD